jgi:hypothetical protein
MRFHNPIGKATTVLVLLAFILTSCSSYKMINRQSETLRTEIKAGDSVKIESYDGGRLQFKVVANIADSLYGKTQHIAFDQIAKIEKKKGDVVKTSIVVLLGGAVVLLVVGSTTLDYGPPLE